MSGKPFPKRPSRLRLRRIQHAVGRASAFAVFTAASSSPAAPPEPSNTDAPGVAESAAPERLPRTVRISLVHSGPEVLTLRERIASWFPPTTQVSVAEHSDVDREQMLTAPGEGEVTLWILQLSQQRALVVFAVAGDDAAARHLVRDVELRNGLDELGLERLAFVIHSAVVALSEGSVTTPREELEQLLESEGVAPAPRVTQQSGESVGPVPKPAAVLAPADVAPAPRAPPPNSAPPQSFDTTSSAQGADSEFLASLAAGYGVRFRGPEGTGHGPLAEISVAWTPGPDALAAVGGGQLMLPSTFEADGREVGLEAAHLYLGVAWDHRLFEGWSSEALIGAGVDLVRIQPPPADQSMDGSSFTPRAAGKQQRPTAEASLGLWYSSQLLAFGLFVQTVVILGDVEYRIAAESGERSVLSARRVQPGLLLRLRFPGQG